LGCVRPDRRGAGVGKRERENTELERILGEIPLVRWGGGAWSRPPKKQEEPTREEKGCRGSAKEHHKIQVIDREKDTRKMSVERGGIKETRGEHCSLS